MDLISAISILFTLLLIFMAGKWWANQEHQDKEDLVRTARRFAESDLVELGHSARLTEFRGQIYYDEREILSMAKEYSYLKEKLGLDSITIVAEFMVGRFLGKTHNEIIDAMKQKRIAARAVPNGNKQS